MESISNLSEYERQNFFLAIFMLILGIITILSYFYVGAGVIFGVLAVLTIIIGLYMSLRISNESTVLKKTSSKKTRS
ncbi:MAG: hypothetical protein ACP5M9_02960 [Candidatus Micrarchaeia archaeon]